MQKNNNLALEAKPRRKFLINSVALVASASAANAFSANNNAGHDHHHHAASRHTELVDSALDCIKTAQYCRDHCIELIRTGDTTLIDCLDIVTDTISMCETLVQFSVSNNRHLQSFAKVCIEVCKDCEKECRLHKDKHKECKACMESCIACIEQLEKLIA